MTDNIRKAIGLVRHQIISPVLMETDRAQMKYFREIAKQEFNMPGQGKKRFAGIDCRPLDRYQLSLSEYPRQRANEEILEEFFLAKIFRKVNKDATISLKNLIYEVPPQYIGKKVELRYRQDNQRELFLYEKDKRITSIKVVDARANGKAYKPRSRNTVIAYQAETTCLPTLD